MTKATKRYQSDKYIFRFNTFHLIRVYWRFYDRNILFRLIIGKKMKKTGHILFSMWLVSLNNKLLSDFGPIIFKLESRLDSEENLNAQHCMAMLLSVRVYTDTPKWHHWKAYFR